MRAALTMPLTVLVALVVLVGCGSSADSTGSGDGGSSTRSSSADAAAVQDWASACPLTEPEAAAIFGRAVAPIAASSDQNCGYDGGALGLYVNRWPDEVADQRAVFSTRGQTRDRPDLGPGAYELYDSDGYPSVELGYAQDDEFNTYHSRTVVAASATMSYTQLRALAEKVYAAVQ